MKRAVDLRKRLREEEAPAPPGPPEPPAKKPKGEEISYIDDSVLPSLSFAFSIDRGSWVISGGRPAVLTGILYFVRLEDKVKFALGVPKHWIDGPEPRWPWIQEADARLDAAVRVMQLADTEARSTWKECDAVPNAYIINFTTPNVHVLETNGHIKPFRESSEAVNGAAVDVGVVPGRYASKSPVKDADGKTRIGLPLFLLGVTILSKMEPELEALKNDMTRPSIFPRPR